MDESVPHSHNVRSSSAAGNRPAICPVLNGSRLRQVTDCLRVVDGSAGLGRGRFWDVHLASGGRDRVSASTSPRRARRTTTTAEAYEVLAARPLMPHTARVGSGRILPPAAGTFARVVGRHLGPAVTSGIRNVTRSRRRASGHINRQHHAT